MELPKILDLQADGPQALQNELAGRTPNEIRHILAGISAVRRVLDLEIILSDEFSENDHTPTLAEEQTLAIEERWDRVENTLDVLRDCVLEIRDSRGILDRD